MKYFSLCRCVTEFFTNVIEFVIIIQGSAKVLVREITELARTVMDERGEHGPIFPRHIRESVRRLHVRGALPHRQRALGMRGG